jgi:hypothetical protein
MTRTSDSGHRPAVCINEIRGTINIDQSCKPVRACNKVWTPATARKGAIRVTFLHLIRVDWPELRYFAARCTM